MARIKNFFKWWLFWIVLMVVIFVVGEPSFRSLDMFFGLIGFCAAVSLFGLAVKGLNNLGEDKQPWGLRNMKQAQPKQQKKKKKKQGFVSSILNAPHAAAQKGANAVGNKILNFGSGSSDSSYDEWKAKKKAAAWDEYQEKDRRAKERYDKIDEALKDQWDAKHKYPDGSFEQYRAQNDADRKFDEANNL